MRPVVVPEAKAERERTRPEAEANYKGVCGAPCVRARLAVSAQFEEAARHVLERHRDALRELAKW